MNRLFLPDNPSVYLLDGQSSSRRSFDGHEDETGEGVGGFGVGGYGGRRGGRLARRPRG